MARFPCYIPVYLSLLVFIVTGCRSPQSSDPQEDVRDQLDSANMACFLPGEVQVLPLTKLISPTNSDSPFHIHAYVSLLDSFDSQIKTPGKFRFELHEKILRSAEPKGKRIKIWPDVDLRDPSANNQHWQDYLRAYEFTLDLDPQGRKNYILQITFTSTTGRRFSSDYTLSRL